LGRSRREYPFSDSLTHNPKEADPAATAQRGQPSAFGRFISVRNSVLARPAWLICIDGQRMTKKAQAAISGLAIAFVVLCPFPTRIAQPVKVEFTRIDGQPVEGVRVHKHWESFALIGSGRDEAVTDASGRAAFPARRAYGSIAMRILGRAVTTIAVHSSYGAMVSFEITPPPPFEVVFRPPVFSPLEPFATSGSYRDVDARVYFPQTSQTGQRVGVTGEFATGSDTLRFQLEEKSPSRSSQATPGLRPSVSD